MMDRIVKARVELRQGNAEGSEECYALCMYLTDILSEIKVDYMLNIDEGWLNCLLSPNDYGDYKLLELMNEFFTNDLAVASFHLEFVNAELI